MFVYVDETLQLGLDCVAPLSARRSIAYGWTMTPRGVATDITVAAGVDAFASEPGAGLDCPIEYCSFHPRPDVAPPDPRRAVVNGFSLVFATPDDGRDLTFCLNAAGALVQADLRDPTIDANLVKATADRDWRASFALLQDCAANPALRTLLRHGGRPFGAFADWVARLPVVRSRQEAFGELAEVEALISAAGEVLLMLRGTAAMARDAVLGAAVIGHLPGEDGAAAEVLMLPVSDWHSTALPGALSGYGRIDAGWLDRLTMLEVVVQAQLTPERRVWLRVQPRLATVPELLDAACRMGEARAETAALDLLRQLIAVREAAFAPALAEAPALPAEAETDVPPLRLAVILNADDPTAARLFHVTAAAFESRCDTLLVMGEAADEVAQVFARRGRIAVTVGAEAAQALRLAGARPPGSGGILAVDAARYADAVAYGRADDAFPPLLQPEELAQLLALHAVAGCAPPLADSLQRLLRLRRLQPGEVALTPVPHAWSSRHAAGLVTDHLARLWVAGQPRSLSRMEVMQHG